MPKASSASPPAVVLDTDLVLSALVFASGHPKFKLSLADREELLAGHLPCCRSVRISARLPKLPLCCDATDQMQFKPPIVTADALLAQLGAVRAQD